MNLHDLVLCSDNKDNHMTCRENSLFVSPVASFASEERDKKPKKNLLLIPARGFKGRDTLGNKSLRHVAGTSRRNHWP